MPRDANGNYSQPLPDVVAGDTIQSAWANTTIGDLSLAMTDSLDRQGRGGMLAPFNFADGTQAAPGATFTNETSTGLYRAAAGDMRVTILGQDVTRWNTGQLQVWDNDNSVWINVLTTESPGTVDDGTADNQVLVWDETTNQKWDAKPFQSAWSVYDNTGDVILTADNVQGVLKELDGILQSDQGAFQAHVSDDTIHWADVPVDGVTYSRKDGGWVVSSSGVSDHNALNGLLNDDHTQYHTDARGDARYYQLASTVADSTKWAGKNLVVTATPGSDPNTIYFVPE